MLAFRSEGEVKRWCDGRGATPGAIFSPSQLWSLAKVWYDDRLDLDWRRRTVEERQQLLQDVGLTGGFWQIVPSR